ncbi:MAG: hypothetical protein GY778_08315 [bacterium]|nr:hypothetical protein [bacterium]
MKVPPVGQSIHTQVPRTSTATGRRGQASTSHGIQQAPTAPPAPADLVDATIAPTSDDDQDAQGAEKVRGVIRNLEAGHFKGVADVRLRINFFDELAARASQRAQTTAQAESQQFVATVGEQVDQLVATLAVEDANQQEAVTEIVSEFDAAVQQAVTDFAASDDGLAGLQEAVGLAFEALVERLRETFAPAPPDAADETEETPLNPQTNTTDALRDAAGPRQPSDTSTATIDDAVGIVDITELPAAPGDPIDESPGQPTNPTDPVDPTVTTFDDALASLVTAFDAALADFLGNIKTSYTLPDPAPYGGHGSAYDKFLAIYNQLRGLEDSGVDALG